MLIDATTHLIVITLTYNKLLFKFFLIILFQFFLVISDNKFIKLSNKIWSISNSKYKTFHLICIPHENLEMWLFIYLFIHSFNLLNIGDGLPTSLLLYGILIPSSLPVCLFFKKKKKIVW